MLKIEKMSEYLIYNRLIIGFYGKAKSGKDTASEYLVKKYNYKRYAFATPIKQACKILYNFTDDELYNDNFKNIKNKNGIIPREKFTKLGDMCKNDNPNFFIERLKLDIDKRLGPVVISDVRYENEINFIKNNGGYIIGINRNIENLSGHLGLHSSEQIDLNKSDFIIENNSSLENFYKNIDELLLNL